MKKKDLRLINLENKVKSNLNKLCDFDLNINPIKFKTNSCFDLHKSPLSNFDNFIPQIDNSKDDIPKFKSKIINMNVNKEQTEILHKWFDSYIDMYNKVIHFFNKNYIYDDIRNFKIIKNDNKILYLDIMNSKNELNILLKQKKKINSEFNKIIKNNNKTKSVISNKIKINNFIKEIKQIKQQIKNLNITIDIKTKKYNIDSNIEKKEYNKLLYKLNWKNVRTKHLKNIRDHIQSKSSKNNKLKIRIHILDCAIKNACTSYKSCMTNFLNNNIKKFKIRYWRHKKKIK